MITIYTDGSCKPNPGPGGWACIALHPDAIYKISGGEKNTTNNRMELIAIIEAVDYHAEHKELKIFSDSRLTINCAKGLWKRKKNLDLWKEFDIVSKGKNIIFEWVKAHNGDHYNEMVDKLAKDSVP